MPQRADETLMTQAIASPQTADPIAHIVASVNDLPPLPAVVSQLLLVLADPNHHLDDLTVVLRTDAALGAAMLRLSNSARYRPVSGRVHALDRAVAVVGEEALIRMVLVRAAGVLRPAELEGYGYGEHGYWRRSLRTAIAASALAGRAGLSPGLAWTAGLMADAGKIVLGKHLAASMKAVLSRLDASGPQGFDEAERHVVGIDHADLGGHLAEAWDLPAPIATAMRWHHQPASAPSHRNVAYVVHVADALAAMASPDPGVDGMRYPLDPDWSTHVRTSEAEIAELLMVVEAGVAETERLMRI